MLPMDFIKFRINRSGEQRLRIGNAIAAVCLFLVMSLFSSTTSYGQGSSGYPRIDYWAAMTEFYEGNSGLQLPVSTEPRELNLPKGNGLIVFVIGPCWANVSIKWGSPVWHYSNMIWR